MGFENTIIQILNILNGISNSGEQVNKSSKPKLNSASKPGHVAKTFGLVESPTNTSINTQEDVIGKIMNGDYSDAKLLEIELNNSSASNDDSDKDKKLLTKQEKREIRNQKYSLSSKLKQKKAMISKSGKNKIQKLRKVGKNLNLQPSGKFRKSGGGYFKRKLSMQASSEFSQ
eukprot:gene17582-23152_t